VELDIAASGFLLHMVRNLVGTLVLVGEGRLSATDIGDILAARDRRVAGPTAPARGLCLTKVEYAPSAFSIQPATREVSDEGRVTLVSLLNDEASVTADDD
jgi:tRNA pseudouridine38-40 synthase